jgi:hypothetical protein
MLMPKMRCSISHWKCVFYTKQAFYPKKQYVKSADRQETGLGHKTLMMSRFYNITEG